MMAVWMTYAQPPQEVLHAGLLQLQMGSRSQSMQGMT